MTTIQALPARTIARPPVDEALDLVAAEISASVRLLTQLEPGEWRQPTDCVGWNVHDVVGHMVGQAEEMARPTRLLRRVRRARRLPGVGVLDGRNRCQVADRADTPDTQLITDLERWGVRAVRAARLIPGPVRRQARLSALFPEARDQPEDSLDFLVRVLMARDLWMHRLDIAAATGRAPVLDDHDHELVRQIVRDVDTLWHGAAVDLELTGPAGGRWTLGAGPTAATVYTDTVTYLRRLSGRPTPDEPTSEGDPATGAALLSLHLEF